MKCGKFNGAPRPCEYIVRLVRHFKVIAKDSPHRPIVPTTNNPVGDPYERMATAEHKTKINKL